MKCKIISLNQTKEIPNLKSLILEVESGETQLLDGHAEAFLDITGDYLILENMAGKRDRVTLAPGSVCYFKNNEAVVVE